MLTSASGLLVLAASATHIEPRTGISFPDKQSGGTLSRLGVRTKGPIKVYAVGEYESGAYMLKMSYSVGAAKMASALADALKPRCSDAALIDDFEACLLKGLPNGAPKGTKLVFSTSGGKLGVAVNDKHIGSIGSKKLCKAFASIYTDRNAVCAMHPIGDEPSTPSGCSTPVRGALIGAGVGYGLGKLFS